MQFPALIDCPSSKQGIGDWMQDSAKWINALLDSRGAVLLRGTGISSAGGFRDVADILVGPLMPYLEGASPRSALGGEVYTSTEYSSDAPIVLHNELSYSSRWPGRVAFGCLTPPAAGGRTPIADSRKVYARITASCNLSLPVSIQYVRHMHAGKGAGVGWPAAFATSDPREAEAYCRQADIECSWLPGLVMRTSQIRPAAIIHPRTGEAAWFNQAHQWHPSNGGPENEALLRELFGDQLPMTALHADGTEINPVVLAAVRSAYEDEQAAFAWQAGDVLLLDNILCAHGREPFTGTRDILVAMGQPIRLDQVTAVVSHG